MKRLALLATLALGLTGMAGVMPAAADQGASHRGSANQGADDRGTGEITTTIPLGWEADGGGKDRLSMPLFNGTNIVPGDSGEQTVAVRNDGPADGVLTASIVNVELGGDPADPFYDELLFNGEPVSAYQHRKTAVLTTWLDRGESTTVNLSYHFPEDSVSGNDPGARMGVSFDVVLEIRETAPTVEERPGPDDGAERPGPGEKPGIEVPGSGGTPTDKPPERNGMPSAEQSAQGDEQFAGQTAEQGGQDGLAANGEGGDDDNGTSAAFEDGLAYTGTDLLWLLGAGLLLALLGLVMLVRRRKAEELST